MDISQDTDVTGRQQGPAADTKLKMVTKKYTTKELKRLGITGLCIEAGDENIVVNQKGNSLILKYYQADSSDYSLGTRNYEIYHGEFTTPEDITMNGGRSGTVKEVLLRRTDRQTSSDKPRTISITLPSDPKYSRIVQLSCDSGNIRLNNCTSTAMLDAETKSGNIYAFNCTSPLLGVGTKSGNMDVKDCTMKELNSMTRSGELLLQLKDSVENYKMLIDTGTKSKISIKGKLYEGGEMVFNKNTSNKIYFDCYNGSLVITEK